MHTEKKMCCKQNVQSFTTEGTLKEQDDRKIYTNLNKILRVESSQEQLIKKTLIALTKPKMPSKATACR